MLLIKTRVKTSNYLGKQTKNSLDNTSEFFCCFNFFILNSIKVFNIIEKLKIFIILKECTLRTGKLGLCPR